MAGEKVLTQADIDAMVAESVQEQAASTAPAMATVQEQVRSTTPAMATVQEQVRSTAPAREAPQRQAAVTEMPRAVPSPLASQDILRTTAAPDDIAALRAILVDLAKRVARVEAAMVKSQQLEKTIAEAKAMANQPPQDFRTVGNQLQELSVQVDGILEKLPSTAGYDIGKTFRCNSCDSQGMVAIRVKCTECGRENWWGWWPKK